MVSKSKLKMALAAEKGVDFGKLHLKKKEKAARKGKAQKSGAEKQPNGKQAEEEWEDVEDNNMDGGANMSEGESASEVEADEPMKVLFRGSL